MRTNARIIIRKLKNSLLTDYCEKIEKNFTAIEIYREQNKNKVVWPSKKERAVKERAAIFLAL